MPQLPAVGATNWGNTLNSFIQQIQSNTDGSINYSTTRPTKTAADAGYTMVDTNTRELIRWTGSAWEILMGGLYRGRIRLAVNTTYYVDNINGNDNNTGEINSPFASIQACVDFVSQNVDVAGKTVTIQIKDSPTPYLGARLPSLGSQSIIQGNPSNLNAVTIDTGNGSNTKWACLNVDEPQANWIVKDLRFISTATTGRVGGLLWCGKRGVMYVYNVNFGQMDKTEGAYHMAADFSGLIVLSGSYQISGGATCHMLATNNSRIYVEQGGNYSAVITNNPQFSVFAYITNWSLYDTPYNNFTFSGQASGKRYIVSNWSLIANGGSQTFFPGDSDGSVESFSIYK